MGSADLPLLHKIWFWEGSVGLWMGWLRSQHISPKALPVYLFNLKLSSKAGQRGRWPSIISSERETKDFQVTCPRSQEKPVSGAVQPSLPATQPEMEDLDPSPWRTLKGLLPNEVPNKEIVPQTLNSITQTPLSHQDLSKTWETPQGTAHLPRLLPKVRMK